MYKNVNLHSVLCFLLQTLYRTYKATIYSVLFPVGVSATHFRVMDRNYSRVSVGE
jgi:hypothetical protein